MYVFPAGKKGSTKTGMGALTGSDADEEPLPDRAQLTDETRRAEQPLLSWATLSSMFLKLLFKKPK